MEYVDVDTGEQATSEPEVSPTSVESVREVIRLDHNGAQSHSNRGAIQHSMGRYESAIIAYGEAIRLNPRKAIFYAFRALSYAALGNLLATGKKREGKQYEEMVKTLPSPLLGEAIGDAGHLLSLAIQDYKDLIRLDSNIVDNPDIIVDTIALAKAYQQLQEFGQAKKALDWYVTRFSKDPTDQDAKYHLRGVYLVRATVHNQMGEHQLAMQDLEEAISIDPQLASDKDILSFKRSIPGFNSKQGDEAQVENYKEARGLAGLKEGVKEGIANVRGQISEGGFGQDVAESMRQKRLSKDMPPNLIPSAQGPANLQDEIWGSLIWGRSLTGLVMSLIGYGDKARELERRRVALRAVEQMYAQEEQEREITNFTNDLVAERWGFPKGTSESELYGSASAPKVPTSSEESTDADKD